MRVETIRILSSWLADTTNGVNALLPAIPLETGDVQPANVTILDETTDPEAARRFATDEMARPALLVMKAREADVAAFITTSFRDANLLVLVAYVAQNADTPAAVRDASYTLRAVLRSLGRLFPGNETARTRNGVQLLNFPGTTLNPLPYAPNADLWFDEALVVPCHVRETDPT